MSQKSLPFNWPLNADGEPLQLVTTSVQETIPTAPYANIQLFASVTRFVENAEEGISEGQDELEKSLSPKRDEIIGELDKD